MWRLGQDVEHAKERVKRHFVLKKDEDRKQEEEARKLVAQVFPQVDAEETLLLLIALGEDFFLKDLRSSVFGNYGREVHEQVSRAQKEVADRLVRKLPDAMKEGTTSSAAVSDMPPSTTRAGRRCWKNMATLSVG